MPISCVEAGALIDHESSSSLRGSPCRLRNSSDPGQYAPKTSENSFSRPVARHGVETAAAGAFSILLAEAVLDAAQRGMGIEKASERSRAPSAAHWARNSISFRRGLFVAAAIQDDDGCERQTRRMSFHSGNVCRRRLDLNRHARSSAACKYGSSGTLV